MLFDEGDHSTDAWEMFTGRQTASPVPGVGVLPAIPGQDASSLAAMEVEATTPRQDAG